MTRALRAVFWLFALALFAATHWPALKVEGPVERTDLWAHLAAFGLWAALLASCGYFGRPLSAPNILRSAAAATLYACFDEGLQAIPALQRTFGWDDLAADILGVWVCSGLLLLLTIVCRRRATPS
ncbi:MAG: VanZ family protein [Phycisphaerales bacterium]|nr:VanZ family protein [Phycisphaerales bacterium]